MVNTGTSGDVNLKSINQMFLLFPSGANTTFVIVIIKVGKLTILSI